MCHFATDGQYVFLVNMALFQYQYELGKRTDVAGDQLIPSSAVPLDHRFTRIRAYTKETSELEQYTLCVDFELIRTVHCNKIHGPFVNTC